MNALSLFGLLAVTSMLVCYALEQRSPHYVLAFAISCGLGSAYGFLQGAWPFGLVEAIWSLVAARRWLVRSWSRSLALEALVVLDPHPFGALRAGGRQPEQAERGPEQREADGYQQ
jgi:hypothetical protein